MDNKLINFEEYVKNHSLGYKREQMPQIPIEKIPDFIMHFVNKGLNVYPKKINCKNLKPAQSEFNEDKIIEKIIKKSEQYKERYFLISNDYYLLDGNHDWAYCIEVDEDYYLNCIVFDLPFKRLVKIAKLLKLSFKKDLNDKIVKSVLEDLFYKGVDEEAFFTTAENLFNVFQKSEENIFDDIDLERRNFLIWEEFGSVLEKAKYNSNLVKTKVWNKKGYWQTVYVSKEQQKKLKESGKLTEKEQQTAKDSEGNEAVKNALLQVLKKKYVDIDSLVVEGNTFHYNVEGKKEIGSWYKTKNFSSNSVIGIKDSGKIHEKKLKKQKTDKYDGKKPEDKPQKFLEKIESKNKTGNLTEFNGFKIGDSVTFEVEGGEQQKGKIKAIKYHEKYDKFGTAVIIKKDNSIINRSLKKLRNNTAKKDGVELLKEHGNKTAMLGNKNAYKGRAEYKKLKNSDFNVIRYLDSSNGAELVENSNGEKFVRKKLNSDHLTNELAASRFYKVLNDKIPSVFEDEDSKYIYSEYLGDEWKNVGDLSPKEYEKYKDLIHSQIKDGFVADAFAANWDVVGANSDNIMINTKTKEISRIDFGGSFYYRAQGEPKKSEFDKKIDEFATLKNSSINEKTSLFFKNVTREQELKQINSLLDKEKEFGNLFSELKKDLNNSNDVLSQRWETLKLRKTILDNQLKQGNTTKNKMFDLTGFESQDVILKQVDEKLFLTEEDKQTKWYKSMEKYGYEKYKKDLGDPHINQSVKKAYANAINSGCDFAEIKAVELYTSSRYSDINSVMARLSNDVMGNINLDYIVDEEEYNQALSFQNNSKFHLEDSDNHPKDKFSSINLKAAKTINHHVEDKKYNQEVLKELKIAQIEIENLLKTKITDSEKSMYNHYLNNFKQMFEKVNDKKNNEKLKQMEPYKLTEEDKKELKKKEDEKVKKQEKEPIKDFVLSDLAADEDIILVKTALSAISKMRKNPSLIYNEEIVHRKIKIEEATETAMDVWLKQHKKGSKVMWQRFNSTSKSKGVWDGNIHISIKHKKGVDVENLSKHKSEQEVILSPFSFFEVEEVKKSNGVVKVIMREI